MPEIFLFRLFVIFLNNNKKYQTRVLENERGFHKYKYSKVSI